MKSRDQPLKSFWKSSHSPSWHFFCPLCRIPRKIPFRPKPGSLRHYFQVALTSVFFSIVFWKWLGWKGIVSFVPFWTVFEFAYRWRVRAVLSCTRCGFDPYLFRVDLQWAKREVDAHWRKKCSEKGVPFPEKRVPP